VVEGLVVVGVLLQVPVELWAEERMGLVVLTQKHWVACLLLSWEEDRGVSYPGVGGEIACPQPLEIRQASVQSFPSPHQVGVPSPYGSGVSAPLE
jgi:hypothetical protein